MGADALNMKFPTLNFEIDLIKTFINNESKFSWLIHQFKIDFNVETQIAILFMVGCLVFGIVTIFEGNWALSFPKKHVAIRTIFFPIRALYMYYSSKLILYWFLWLTTFSWWAQMLIALGTGIVLCGIILFIVKFIDKE